MISSDVVGDEEVCLQIMLFLWCFLVLIIKKQKNIAEFVMCQISVPKSRGGGGGGGDVVDDIEVCLQIVLFVGVF